MITLREIGENDVPGLFDVRAATDENTMSREALARIGITETSVREKLCATYRGWLAEEAGRIVGFAIGNAADGELWVIAVLPSHIKQGIGSQLLAAVERWLGESGCRELWLETALEPTTRAYHFYRRRGWVDDRIEGRARIMKKVFPRSE